MRHCNHKTELQRIGILCKIKKTKYESELETRKSGGRYGRVIGWGGRRRRKEWMFWQANDRGSMEPR
jgi:hypothetical protein